LRHIPDREQNRKRTGQHQGQEGSVGLDIPDREWPPGEFVRRRRNSNGLTQAELGELTGVGTRFISELERGKPTLRLDKVSRSLAVFGKRLGLVDAPRGEADR